MPARVQLGLFGGEGTHDHAPAHHADTAVDQLLQVDTKERRVQFNPPVVIPDEVAGEAVVLRAGPVAALEIQE